MRKIDIQMVNGDADYEELIRRVGDALKNGRNALVTAVNTVMVHSYPDYHNCLYMMRAIWRRNL